MRKAALGGLAILLLAGASSFALPSRAQDKPGDERIWTATYPLESGGRVQVANVQGSITVEGWDRAEIEVTAVQTPGTTDGGEPVVGVERGPDWISLRTLYPADGNAPVQLDYYLRVPRQVQLDELLTVNGRVRVRDVEGRVAARTLNGDIEQERVSGSVTARALNGSIRLALRALPGRSAELSLETVNGDLLVLLPPRADADLELSTVAGRVENQFVVPASESSSAEGGARRVRLGRGGPTLKLRTVRGNIRLGQNQDVY
ncbi:MAG TPA: hypothetical protein VGA39_03440 [Candidatus Acidoferrales bacterium]